MGPQSRPFRNLAFELQTAFFQLVLYPTKASAQVVQIYVAAAKNQLYATQGRVSANDWAERTRRLFQEHAELSYYYNHTLAGGKWDHMMDQTHLGYTWWQQPPVEKMPSITEVLPLEAAQMGTAVEGSIGPEFRPLALPQFDIFNQQRYWIDVFNRGKVPFQFSATADESWIRLSSTRGNVDKEERLWVSIEWDRVPQGTSQGTVSIAGPNGARVNIKVAAFHPAQPTRSSLTGFVEADGFVSMEAAHYTNKVDTPQARWEVIPDLGRTLSSMSIFPVTASSADPPRDSPRLEYKMYLFHPGPVEVEAILAPTQNFVPGRGLRYAISWDDEAPRVIDALEHNSLHDWEETVKDSVRKVKTECSVPDAGYHTLKFWMIDPGVVLQKVVVNTGGLRPSYLGPPESYVSH